MSKLILLFSFLSITTLTQAQEAKNNQKPYILDSTDIVQTGLFIDALKEKALGNNL
jgi:hypothetical protein